MATTNEKSEYQIKYGYKIEMQIGEMYYESDLTNVQIINSLNASYPVYIIKLNLRPIEVIQNKIFGQSPIKLTINHFHEGVTSTLDQPYIVNLFFLSGDFDIPPSSQMLSNSDSLQELVPYTIRCVPELAFTFFTLQYNFIFRNATVADIYAYISFKAINEINKPEQPYKIHHNFDAYSPYRNEQKIEQLILPPTIIKNHFDYLLEEFGMFYNWGCIYASVSEARYDDNNKNKKNLYPNDINVQAMDIGYRFTLNPIFEIKQLSLNSKNDMEEYGYDNFYLTQPIHTKYIANSVIGNIGNNQVHIHKPINKFNYIDEILVDENQTSAKIPDDFVTDNHDLYLSELVESRKVFYNSHIVSSRYKDDNSLMDEAWLCAKINKSIMNFSQLTCRIEKNAPIFRFSNIGQPVNFTSETAEYKPYNGKYILFSSILNLKRSKIWEMTTEMKLIRPFWSLSKDD